MNHCGFYIINLFNFILQLTDLKKELLLINKNFINGAFNNTIDFKNAIPLEILEEKLPHKENCVIKKGYFPNSAVGINSVFCFVNLDMDLYAPMLAGLEFFYDKMVAGGVILLHDYYHPQLPGVKKALEDWQVKYNDKICCFPIGDECSIAVIKK